MENKKHIHKNHRQRMKELYLKNGFDGFSDIEKLEFILYFAIPQKDTNPIAHALLDEFKTLDRVFAAEYEDLLKVNGIGEHAAILIKTINSASRENINLQSFSSLMDSIEAKDYCYRLLFRAPVEEFYAIAMDDSNRIIATKKINSGTANKVKVPIRDITDFIFKHRATKLVVAHNHPSGNLKFSNEDIHFTHSIICSCLLNEIDFVDHILVTPQNSISLSETNYVVALYNNSMKNLNLRRKFNSNPACPYKEYIVCNRSKEIPDVSHLVGDPAIQTFMHTEDDFH